MDLRAGHFTARLALEKGRMTAYMVTRIGGKDPGYPEGFIADMLALPGRPDAAEALLRDALSQFRDAGANAVHCMLPTTSPYAPVLKRCGFVDTRVRETVYVSVLGEDPLLLDAVDSGTSGSHHVSYADFDLI
jgi:hypothetical protein